MATTDISPQAFSVLGAAPDTNNLGVRALLASVLNAIDVFAPNAVVNVLDNGYGSRAAEVDVGGRGRPVELIGARSSKRIHRTDTLVRIALDSQLGVRSNPAAAAIRGSNAALDISAGDSFSDMYGWSRFTHILLQKQICLRQRTPLLLMPQTFGPYRSPAALRLARSVLRRADIAIARDRLSFECLQTILGSDFDSQRHRLGVDLAFGLPPTEPDLTDDLADWLAKHRPVAGLNVSGLLYNDTTSSHRFGLACDYRSCVRAVMERLLGESDASILLVPHVISPSGRPESDVDASHDVLGEFQHWGTRVRVAETQGTAATVKGLIAQTDWFAGSRMHATIAALSSGVPAASLAYSGKASGVFESAGVAAHVIDLRTCSSESVAEQAMWSFAERDQTRSTLSALVPRLRELAVAQVGEALSGVGADETRLGVDT